MFALCNRTFTVSGQETPSTAWPSTGRKEDVCFQKKLNIPHTPPLASPGTSKLTAAPLAPVDESKNKSTASSLALELAYHDTTHNGRQRRVFIHLSTTVKQILWL